MASSNTTENFGLNQWLSSDQVLREDFNSDNMKIEEALFALAPVRGTYTGTQANYSADGGHQDIDLGFYPSAVLVLVSGLEHANYYDYLIAPMYATRDAAHMDIVTNFGFAPVLEVTETGFTVKAWANIVPDSTKNGYKYLNPYHYIAWR